MTRPLKIAVVTETFPPEVNGVAMTIGVMVNELTSRGHYIELIRPTQHADRFPKTRTPHVEVLVSGLPIPGYPALRIGLPATRMLKQRWSAVRPDVVQLVTEGPLGFSAMLAARKLGIPVVSEYHTNFNAYARHYGKSWLKQPIAGYLKYLHNATAVTLAPTVEMAESLRRCGYKRVEVVSRGVDTQRFSPDLRNAQIRRMWGAGPDDLVVMHVGRLAPEKNLDLVFAAFDEIVAVAPGARLALVGDGPERARLTRKYPNHFFAGVQRGQSLAAHYASADIFLYPSMTETFGNVTLEAMASGLAVVAFDYAAARDHIRHDVSGLLPHFGDHGEFKSFASSLAADPNRCGRLGRAARASALRADWGRVIDSLEIILFETSGQPAFRERQTTFLSQEAAS